MQEVDEDFHRNPCSKDVSQTFSNPVAPTSQVEYLATLNSARYGRSAHRTRTFRVLRSRSASLRKGGQA